MKKTLEERFQEKIDKTVGCWEWLGCKNMGGYGMIRVDGRLHQAHRISYALYNGEIPDGMCICHRCDNPGCVNPTHLFLGTKLDNAKDRERKGRGVHNFSHGCGDKSSRAKLTWNQVNKIREKWENGATQASLAEEFEVTRPTINQIVHYRTWPNP
ncbi:MAG: HNH endonuclease [Candidatus Sumerlaeales bacterium]|nr:HNH endonuclease [Candidatus Sumerlaeales bacterium]